MANMNSWHRKWQQLAGLRWEERPAAAMEEDSLNMVGNKHLHKAAAM